MELNVLADSSFFIHRLRRGQNPFRELAEADDKYEFYSCGVVMAEVCMSFGNEALNRRVADAFEVMCWVPTTIRVWERVSRLGWELARKGIQMKIPDLTIAASALEADAAVLTLDSDFDFVPGLHVISSLD
jgi:predicted nucleic acid-binding protein